MARHNNNSKAIIITVVILVVIGIFFYSTGRKASTDTVIRTFTTSGGGNTIASDETVTVTYKFTASLGDTNWAVEEMLPAGWTFVSTTPTPPRNPTAIDAGTSVDSGTGRVKVRFTTAIDSIDAKYKAPTVGTSGAAYIFDGGLYWTVGRSFTDAFTGITLTVPATCANPKTWIEDGVSPHVTNCIIESNEWDSFISKWKTGLETSAHFAEAGNVFFTGGHY